MQMKLDGHVPDCDLLLISSLTNISQTCLTTHIISFIHGPLVYMRILTCHCLSTMAVKINQRDYQDDTGNRQIGVRPIAMYTDLDVCLKAFSKKGTF